MIEIRDLTKTYGALKALDGLTMTVREKTVYGFVGPNGAGKTTAMAIVATLIRPTSGTARVGGYDVTEHPDRVRRLIGYMPDFFGVYDRFKAAEYLDFYGACYGIPRVDRLKKIPRLLELVDLADKADAYVDSLSRGMKQRLCLARCLMHDPEVLVLDEPASGLDPRARIEMREILKELKKMGKTILISSHVLPELAEMADDIGVIENGRLLAQGNVREIQERMRAGRLLHIRLLDRAGEAVEFLRGRPYVAAVESPDDAGATAVRVRFGGDDAMQRELLRVLVESGFPVVAFHEEEADLEDVFLEITKGGRA
ncbi:MAG: ABC transporter [Candidatus Reconcilbacillus cellulovorans]|uniref:ABC transporter n=1 Tax=Candidatus Reconcilbacillus cellulovorans TaxID=1906605 RepID=A0A2A6E1B4_9BACL|nr:MAG: ABC transporter [Candidatus Reconcilbacillus cellulovorans]